MRVERWDPERDGPFSEAAMRAKLERLGYAVSAYEYPPGTRFDTHQHGVDKIDGVVSGRFEIEMAAGSVVLEAGDFVYVPRSPQPERSVRRPRLRQGFGGSCRSSESEGGSRVAERVAVRVGPHGTK